MPSYGSAVPEGVPIRVMTSQSIVLSGEGAKVSEITPKKSDNPFFTFSVASEEPSVTSFSLTTLVVAAMVQAVSCWTTWVNSVRSRFMNSKASVDFSLTAW